MTTRTPGTPSSSTESNGAPLSPGHGPRLQFFAGLWTLEGHPAADREWSLEEKFAEVKRRGFDAIGGRFVPGAPELCAAHGLDYVLYVDAGAADFSAQLHRAREWNPRRINVQLGEHDTPPAEAAQTWIEIEALAAQLGLVVDLELHRDTATETPEKAGAIAARYFRETGRTIRFCPDFSHFAVTKHLAPPFAPRLLADPQLIATARQFHLRPFNGHHAQIPVTDQQGKITPECRDYLAFVDELFALLIKAAAPGEIFHACPENGPRRSGYALSCFPDVWQDAVRMRDEARALWRKQGGR